MRGHISKSSNVEIRNPKQIRIFKILILILFVISFFGFRVYSSAQTLININTAAVTELKTLNGIGDVKAQAIIDYRNANGPFAKIEDINNVSGIGDATFSNIKDYITVGEESKPITNNQESTSSVHYGSNPISTGKKVETENITVSAGRDRIGAVGSPLEFRAETDLPYTRSSLFKWNFGDGTEGAGEALNHTYEYPGDYTVVLNVTLPEGQVVSRVNVKIIEPQVTIVSATPERIELKNNAKQEVSLYGRALLNGPKFFTFPQDTIIKPGQSIYFSSKATGLYPGNLYEVQIVVVGGTEQAKIKNKIEEEKSKKMASIQNQISILKRQLAAAPINPIQEHNESIVEGPAVPQTAVAVKSGWLKTLKKFFLRKQ
ncbi:MAG: helix-hairpin-helix domain-containing protein [Patescibacteria group bacterium]